MSTTQKLITLIQQEIEGLDNIEAEDNLIEIGFDSLKFIKLVVLMENEFNIVFDDEDLNYLKFNTVLDLVDYVNARMGVPSN